MIPDGSGMFLRKNFISPHSNFSSIDVKRFCMEHGSSDLQKGFTIRVYDKFSFGLQFAFDF